MIKKETSLTDFLEEYNIPQWKIEEEAGIGKGTIKLYVGGHKIPSAALLSKITKAVNKMGYGMVKIVIKEP